MEQQPATPPAPDHGQPPALEPPVEAGAWSYEMLSPEERAVIDRGREVAGWDRVQRGFADAARAQAAIAPTEAGAR